METVEGAIPMGKSAFVAGATGYTGREVVRLLVEHGVETVAHIRPESSKRERYTERFEDLGAVVDTTPWRPEAMGETLGRLEPDLVFCLIGTTGARKRKADEPEQHTYEAVDYGLTDMLVQACRGAELDARLVYISAVGVGPDAKLSYMKAHWKAERSVVDSGLPYTVVRPSFISGPGRDDPRPAERLGSAVSDAALSVLGLVGFGRLRDRYQSMTNTELATHLVDLALSPQAADCIADCADLRRADPPC
jgi:uncharacterized protein YbjT (DUF2867 family)